MGNHRGSAYDHRPHPPGTLADRPFGHLLGPDDPPLKALARAIRICHAMYCPHHVALTGGIGIRMKHLLATIRRLLEPGRFDAIAHRASVHAWLSRHRGAVAAALGAEGLAADVTMLVGNGYVPGHADYALGLLRGHDGVRKLFERRL